MANKVLLTATVQSHICQFHKPLVEVLHRKGYEVHVAARNNLAEKNGLALDFVEKVYDIPFSRSPKSRDNLQAYRELKKILSREQYDVIHCNTPMGGVVTRLAASKIRRHGTKVFYTAHGFHFYKGAPLKNWIIFYPIEKIFSRLTDKLITITEEDYRLAKRKFHCKAEHIHGVGVYSEKYHPIDDNERLERRREEGLSGDDYVILCTGELNENKNQKTLIRAAEILRGRIPELKVLLAGNGPLEEQLREQIREAGLEKTVTLLGYRTDLYRITPAVDLVVSCSCREGMPLNIIEAMLCEKPVVASVNRGHKELVSEGITGFLVIAEDAAGFAARIAELYHDRNRALQMGVEGLKKAQAYTAENVRDELLGVYDRWQK